MSFIDYSKSSKKDPIALGSGSEMQQASENPDLPNPESKTSTSNANLKLTSTQRHYLLKALILMQMAKEGSDLEKVNALEKYGHPFRSTSKPAAFANNGSIKGDPSELLKGDFEESALDGKNARDAVDLDVEPLILRQCFHKHLLPFPGLNKAPTKYWVHRIQAFFNECAARNFS